MSLIFIILQLLITVIVNTKAEIIKDNCIPEGELCSFSNSCCSNRCIYRRGFQYSGRFCRKNEDEPVTTTTTLRTVVTEKTCLPYAKKCSVSGDCCSKKCDRICVPQVKDLSEYVRLMRTAYPAFCFLNGAKCNTASECCSTRCHRPKGKLQSTCAPSPE